MGNEYKPGEDEFGVDCTACFPVDLTPLKILASFSGIEYWFGYQYDDLPNPNIQIWCEQTTIDGKMAWVGEVGRYKCTIYLDKPGSSPSGYDTSVELAIDGGRVFCNESVEKCTWLLENDDDAAFPLWQGRFGLCALSFVPETTGPSITTVGDSIGLENGENVKYDIYALNTYHIGARFVHKRTGSVIDIAFDPDDL